MKLSVVIPALDEEDFIGRALSSVPADAEVIVADGNSRDRTVEIAARAGAEIVRGARGRGAQMNRGAGAASGDVLLFLHADCELPPGAGEAIGNALEDPDVPGGSFRLQVRDAGWALGLVTSGSNFRSRRLHTPYGDQAIFVRRSVFESLGGYRELPIMEDIDLSRRLKKRGRLVALDLPVMTSSRHWEALGPLLTTGLNWGVALAFLLGVSPERLAPVYHRLRRSRWAKLVPGLPFGLSG